MSKIIKITKITKTDFQAWIMSSLTDDEWQNVVNEYTHEIEGFIDYLTETLVDDHKTKSGIFQVNQLQQGETNE